MKSTYKELLIEQKKERIKFKIKEEIEKDLLNKIGNIDFKIFVSELWGRQVHINLFDEFRKEGANLEQINKILDAFKPIPCFLSGGNSFRMTKNIKEANKPINPYVIRYEGFNQCVFIEWFTKLKGYVVEITLKVNKEVQNKILSVRFDRHEFKGDFEIINFSSQILGNFDDGNYKKITWARGSNHYPNDISVYSENLETNFKEYLNK